MGSYLSFAPLSALVCVSVCGNNGGAGVASIGAGHEVDVYHNYHPFS
jgi:hypothetical protein